MQGTQAKGRNDTPLKATDCPEESPEELTWDTIPLFSSSPASPSSLLPLHPPPCQSLCWQPRKETHLRKQWAVERSQLELMRTAPQNLEQQAGLPWPLASLHVPATIDPPHHLGFPAHCGNSPAAYNRDTGDTPTVA